MKEHTKKRVRRLLAGAVTASMALALIPNIAGKKEIRAAWEKTQENTQLGVSQIKGPNKETTATSEWKGSYVYFGNYVEGEKSSPIKFRVLAPTTNKYGGTTMFLDSDSVLFKRGFNPWNANIWYDEDAGISCELRSYLNGDFLAESFTDAEQEAIVTSKADSHDLVKWVQGEEASFKVADETYDLFKKYVGINEKIFVLDAEEVSNCEYGYNVSDKDCTSRVKNMGSSAYLWWLRSAYSNNFSEAGYVYDVGWLNSYIVYSTDFGVAPALNINQSSIIFSSLISGTSGEYGAEYKLTVADPKIKIAVPAGQSVAVSGKTITVPYAISGDNAGTATRTSVLILDKKYEAGKTDNTSILYYDALGGQFSNSAAATGTFTLPDDLKVEDWGTGYYVYILAEDVNGTYETDYASTPVEITIPYTVTYKVVNGTWSDGTTAPKTETVARDASPASVPTGMIASSSFEGGSWDTDPSTASITGDMTFTYTFAPVDTYTVTVQSDGNGTASADVAYGATGTEVTLTATPSAGYQFKEWQVVSGGVTITSNKFTIGTEDVVVKAVFEEVPATTYTVTFETNGGSAVASQKVEDGSKATKPADPTKEGYTFDGWYKDAALTVAFDFETAISVDITLYAKWTQKAQITYTVVNGADGSWKLGSGTDYTLTVKRSEDDPSCIDHFTGVQTDGAALVKDSHYTAKPGSTVITLKNSYLESLSEGKHTITVNFDDGSVSVEITVQAADKKEVTLIPKTGETGCIAVLGVIMVFSAAGCLITLEREKKRRRNAR